MTKKRKSHTFHYPPEVVDRVREIAKAEGVSITDTASRLLSAAVELYDQGRLSFQTRVVKREITSTIWADGDSQEKL